MYLPPCKSFLAKKFRNFSKNFPAQMWVLSNTYFDPSFYYEKNPDLHEKYDESDHRGLWSHYILNGWEEGRFPFRVKVDEIFYFENYPDAKLYDGSAQEHFVKHGYKEGRLPYMFSLDLDQYNERLFLVNPKEKMPSNKYDYSQNFNSIFRRS